MVFFWWKLQAEKKVSARYKCSIIGYFRMAKKLAEKLSVLAIHVKISVTEGMPKMNVDELFKAVQQGRLMSYLSESEVVSTEEPFYLCAFCGGPWKVQCGCMVIKKEGEHTQMIRKIELLGKDLNLIAGGEVELAIVGSLRIGSRIFVYSKSKKDGTNVYSEVTCSDVVVDDNMIVEVK